MSTRVLMHCDVDCASQQVPPEAGKYRLTGTKRKLPAVDNEQEKARRREKNRIAARDSRARKMQTLVNLRTDVASLHNANEQLKAKISEVTEQATVAQQLYWQLKGQIEAARSDWGLEEKQLIDDILEQLQSSCNSYASDHAAANANEAEPSISHSDSAQAEVDSPGCTFTGACNQGNPMPLLPPVPRTGVEHGERPPEPRPAWEKPGVQQAGSPSPMELLGLVDLSLSLDLLPTSLLL